MSWLTFWQTTEADVLKIVVTIKKDIAIVESDVSKALQWLANNSGTIAADVQSVLSVVQILGISNPEVEAAVIAANSAVSALNKFAADYNAGKGTPASVVAGYSAFKQAQASAAQAASVAVASK